MIETLGILARPSGEALLVVLSYERRILQRLLFKQAETAMLVAAGAHRFLARSLDEVADVEAELGAVELVRSAVVEGLGCPDHAQSLQAVMPAHLAGRLEEVLADLASLTADINDLRRQTEQACSVRAGAARTAQRGPACNGPPPVVRGPENPGLGG